MYLFFIRRFPDLDHFFPIIYHLAKDYGVPVSILCQNPDFKIHDDFILNFLKKEFGIPAGYTHNVDQSFFRHIVLKIFLKSRRIHPGLGTRLFNVYHHLPFHEKWAENLLAKLNPSLVIMDFNQSSYLSTGRIVEVSRKRGTPVVLMTHGVTMRLSGLGRVDDIPMADYNILPNKMKMNYYQTNGAPVQHINILGAPRYCAEWERTYNNILENAFSCPDLPQGDGKLKVLYFERPMIGLDSRHEAYKTVERLDFVHSVFKERLEKKNPYYKSTETPYPSARLIQWADVVVMSVSSIALEVLWHDKPLLFLKYLSPAGEVCAFDKYEACWPIHSKDELIEAIKTLRENPDYRPYKKENVIQLFRDFVYNGDENKNIIEDHIQFFRDIAAGPEDGEFPQRH